MKKILIVCPYPSGQAPSQRFRFEQYLNHLRENGALVEVKPFFTERTYAAVYHSGKLLPKIRAIAHSYICRLLLFLHVSRFDFVFIHREATPAGPPLAEWIIGRLLGKKIIYDFDDAIWLTDAPHPKRWMDRLRWRDKVAAICRWSYKVSCGNSFLAAYALQYNRAVTVMPTTIDTAYHRPVNATGLPSQVTIGWTGSRSTLKYLAPLIPVFRSIEQKYPHARLLIIADRDPALPLKNVMFRRWQKATEIDDLTAADIGIMPLPDDEWTRGKCGFKALQYMALEIPALVSPVGVNREIVAHGVDGYWCETTDEWFARLEELILDSGKRAAMGKHGRCKVVERYSTDANASTFLSLFQ